MNQTKSINVDVDITLKSTNVRTLDAVLYSQDTNAPQVVINVKKDSIVVTDVVTATLLLSSANYRGYVSDGLSVKLDGTIADGSVTFDLPNELLSYQGYVRADLYLYWQDGANDAAQPFIFSVKKSTIDAQASVLSHVYISDFEREKLRVTQAADAAINTIDTNETIAQFNHDKQDVANAKTDALATITNAPDELTSAIAETKAIISKRPDELNDAINQAQDTITQKVSSVDAQSAISSISQIVDNVDTAKSQAISSINSQTDLSADVSQAKKNMATSVANVQQTASTESDKITSLLPELESEVSTLKTDLQNLSTGETQAISAIRPKLLQDISDTTAKIDELIALQNQNAITKQVQTAWANSADGVTDFTNVKPNENLMSAKGNVEDDSKNGFIIMNGNTNTPQLPIVSNNFSKLKGSEEKTYTLSVYYISGDAFKPDGTTSNTFGMFTINGNTKTQINWSRSSNNYKKWDLVGKKTFTLKLDEKSWFQWWAGSSFIFNNLTIAVKLEEGEANTKYLASDYISVINSLMQYKGISNINSTNPNDYKWSQSDEYRDYKEDKLTQAIIALGGTV